MSPREVRPDPGAKAQRLDRPDEEIEIVPPEFMLANDHDGILRLVLGGFLVITEMEEAGLAEKGSGLGDELGATPCSTREWKPCASSRGARRRERWKS